MHVVAAIVVAVLLALTAAGPAAAATRYTVAPHDTLFSVARRFHVPLQLLAQVNGIHDPSRIRIGDVLTIPGEAAAPGTPVVPMARLARQLQSPVPSRLGPSGRTAVAAPSASVPYAVRPGDTLYHLAVTHGTTVQALEEANGLTSPAIIVGQVLRLPRTAEPGATVPPADAMPSDLSRFTPAEPNHPGLDEPALPANLAPRPVPPVRSALPARVRASALRYVGTPYVWGGTTPAGVDCSGLVHLVYSPYVPGLPRTSYEQWTAGTPVDRTDLTAGDLVFFNTDGTGASHVGIYIGEGEFVHSASSAQRVLIDRLDAPYYVTHYLGARRIL